MCYWEISFGLGSSSWCPGLFALAVSLVECLLYFTSLYWWSWGNTTQKWRGLDFLSLTGPSELTLIVSKVRNFKAPSCDFLCRRMICRTCQDRWGILSTTPEGSSVEIWSTVYSHWVQLTSSQGCLRKPTYEEDKSLGILPRSLSSVSWVHRTVPLAPFCLLQMCMCKDRNVSKWIHCLQACPKMSDKHMRQELIFSRCHLGFLRAIR